MATIIVGFSRPRKFFAPFSWLIRLIDWTPYSHTYIKFYSQKYDCWLVYQASGLFVNFFGPSAFAREALVIEEFDLEIDDATMISVVKFAIQTAGVPYGVTEIVGIGWVKFMAFFGKKIRNPFRNGKFTFICSELVAEILVQHLGVQIQEDVETMTPKDVYNYVSHIKAKKST